MKKTEKIPPKPSIDISPLDRQAIRRGAYWILATSPYLLLYLVLGLVLGVSRLDEGLPAVLSMAGAEPIRFGAIILSDGLFHVLFFGTAAVLFLLLRSRWPLRSGLLLVFGAAQMVLGFTKSMISFYVFTALGKAYLAGDAAARSALLAVATGTDALRQALQQLDTFGVIVVLALIASLPSETGVPRAVRGLGLVLILALLGPDPGFLAVLVLGPVFQGLLGLWVRRQTLSR